LAFGLSWNPLFKAMQLERSLLSRQSGLDFTCGQRIGVAQPKGMSKCVHQAVRRTKCAKYRLKQA
jgi:hypothetical protein